MKITKQLNDNEKLVFETIQKFYYLDLLTGIIKPTSRSVKTLNVDLTLVQDLCTKNQSLLDMSANNILTILQDILEVKNNLFVHIEDDTEVFQTSVPDVPTFIEFSDYVTYFEEEKHISQDSDTLEYFIYDSNLDKKRDLSVTDYEKEINSFTSTYNRYCKLYSEQAGKKIVYPKKNYQISVAGELSHVFALSRTKAKRYNAKRLLDILSFNGLDEEQNIAYMTEIMKEIFVPKNINGFDVDIQNISARMMMHWMWLVKRNIGNKLTVNEIMVIMFSKVKGIGKSNFLQNLIAVIGSKNIASIVLPDLEDARNSRLLEMPILYVDEADGGKTNADMGVLKKRITEKSTTMRTMYTTDHVEIPRKFSAIGASNKRINEYLGSEDGHRRFFEIPVTNNGTAAHMPKKYLEEGADVYLEMWKTVDESLDKGYLHEGCDIWLDVKSLQNTYSNNNTIDRFFKDSRYTYILKSKHTKKSIKDFSEDNNLILEIKNIDWIYDQYERWIEENKIKAKYNKENFKEELINKNIISNSIKLGEDINGNIKYDDLFYFIENRLIKNEVVVDKVQTAMDRMKSKLGNVDTNAKLDTKQSYINSIPKLKNEEDSDINHMIEQDDF